MLFEILVLQEYISLVGELILSWIFSPISEFVVDLCANLHRKLITMIMDEHLILPGETMMILTSTSGVIFETFLFHKFFL